MSPLPEVIQLMAGICFPGQPTAVPVIFSNCALIGTQQWEETNLRWVTAVTKDVGEHEFIFFILLLLLLQAKLT